ncbi:MAG TPA: ATP-binding protein, partial [Agitococcus sp.]|nr:ATP-binding protein [Agitococcus sp.]
RRRSQEIRCVVLYADKQNELNYLFIRQAYDIALFVQENNIIENPDLRRELHKKNIQCSGRINSTQKYKQIIQGVGISSIDKQEKLEAKGLIHEYAFTVASQPLKHIEKIVSGMFKRRTHFDDLQMMVVDCIGDNQQQAKLILSRDKIEKWPQDYLAYQAVMTKQPTINEALALNAHYVAAEQEMCELHGQWLSWLNFQQVQHQQLETERTQLSRDKQDQELFSEGKIKKYQLDIQHLQQQAAYCQKQAQELEKQQQYYQQQKMDEKEAFVRQATDLRHLQAGKQKELDTVLGEQKQITVNYQQREVEEQQYYQEQENLLNQQVVTLKDDYHQQSNLLQVSYQQQQDDTKQQIEQQKQALQPTLNQLNQELGHYKSLMQFAQATPDILQQAQDKELALNEQRQLVQQLEKKLQILQQDKYQLSQTFSQTEQVIEKQKQMVNCLEKEQYRLQAFYAPPANSLLAFLRQEYPQWQHDIAKV